jgi:hypothetical protein
MRIHCGETSFCFLECELLFLSQGRLKTFILVLTSETPFIVVQNVANHSQPVTALEISMRKTSGTPLFNM